MNPPYRSTSSTCFAPVVAVVTASRGQQCAGGTLK